MGRTATENGKLTPAAETWLSAMQSMGVTAMDISAALEAMVLEGGDFPPSLPKWLRLCKPPKEEVPAYHRPYISQSSQLAISDGRTPEEKRQERIRRAAPHIQAIREALRKGSGGQ